MSLLDPLFRPLAGVAGAGPDEPPSAPVCDPRAEILSEAAGRMYRAGGDMRLYGLSRYVEEKAVELPEEYGPSTSESATAAGCRWKSVRGGFGERYRIPAKGLITTTPP